VGLFLPKPPYFGLDPIEARIRETGHGRRSRHGRRHSGHIAFLSIERHKPGNQIPVRRFNVGDILAFRARPKPGFPGQVDRIKSEIWRFRQEQPHIGSV